MTLRSIIPLVVLAINAGVNTCLAQLASSWNNANGGAFEVLSNWNTMTVPGQTDSALFGLLSNYTVEFTSDPTNSFVSVNRGNVTFDFNDHSYTIDRGINVSGTGSSFAQLTLTQGTFHTNSDSRIGGTSTSAFVPDQVIVGADAIWESAATIRVSGVNSGGQLYLQQGGIIDSRDVVLGDATGEQAVAFVDIDSRWTTAERFIVGFRGNAELNIVGSGEVSVGSLMLVGDQMGSSGNVNINSGLLSSNGNLYVGESGVGQMDVFNGGNVTVDGFWLIGGAIAETTGHVVVRGASSSVEANVLWLGRIGTGTLVVESGGLVDVESTDVGIFRDGAPGHAIVRGVNAVWDAGILQLLRGEINIENGGRLRSSGSGSIGSTLGSGVVRVSGNGAAWEHTGPINVGLSSAGGRGEVTVSSGGVVSTATNQPLTIRQSGVVTLDGGRLDVGTLNIQGGEVRFNSGVLNITGTQLFQIGDDGPLGDIVVLDSSREIRAVTAQAQPGSQLIINGGQFRVTNELTNEAEILLTDDKSRLSAGAVLNRGVVRGSGRISGGIFNAQTGQVIVDVGDRLVLNGGISNVQNLGTIHLNGGELDTAGSFTNDGLILGRGVLRSSATATFENNGRILLSGGVSDVVVWRLTNNSEVIVTGSSIATFRGVIENAGFIETTVGSTSVFPGLLLGGRLTGGGTVLIAGGLSPNFCCRVPMDADLQFGAGSELTLRIVGQEGGALIDELQIDGTVRLGGRLSIDFDNYPVSVGEVFELITATEGVDGRFDDVGISELFSLNGPVDWQIAYDADAVRLLILAQSIAGDYNGNGTVDAADYVVWRNGLGTAYTQSHYDVWRSNFGQSAPGSGAVVNAQAVPEPGHAAILMLGLCAFWKAHLHRAKLGRRTLLASCLSTCSRRTTGLSWN